MNRKKAAYIVSFLLCIFCSAIALKDSEMNTSTLVMTIIILLPMCLIGAGIMGYILNGVITEDKKLKEKYPLAVRKRNLKSTFMVFKKNMLPCFLLIVFYFILMYCDSDKALSKNILLSLVGLYFVFLYFISIIREYLIDGIKQRAEDGRSFDYVGVLYPEGYINDKYRFVFNHEDIEVVYFMGYVDIEHTVFRKKLEKKLQDECVE